MNEFDAAILEGYIIFEKPACEHRRKHAVRYSVAGFFSLNVEFYRVNCVNVILRAGINVKDIWCDGVEVFIDTKDAADNAITENGVDWETSMPFSFAFLTQSRIPSLIAWR